MAEVPPSRPAFAYYDDPYADGTFEPSDAECSACGLQRGLLSTCVAYGEEVPDDAALCPWCIADGTAQQKLGAHFNQVGPDAAPDARDEVTFRTPGFVTWQDWHWPTHCNDVGVYRGQPTGPELRANPPALQALVEDLSQWPWGQDEAQVEEFLDGLGGSQVAYLFDCRHCGTPLIVWDQD